MTARHPGHAAARGLRLAVATTLLAAAALTGCAGQRAGPSAADGYRIEVLLPGSAMHGVHGLAMGPDGDIYGASLTGYSIYRIDPRSGRVTTAVAAPQGNADDVAFGPAGTPVAGLMVWTAAAFGEIKARGADGQVRTLASGLPGANSVNFAPDGRLFATRVFAGDALYEIDTTGVRPPRLIADKLGGLNGFEVTADNKRYGPLFFKGKVVEVDLATGLVREIARGFKVPAAVNIDRNGNLYVVDIASGEITRLKMGSWERSVVATLEPPLDNLVIDDRGWLYVSNPAFNRITEVNPATGTTRVVVTGSSSTPAGLAVGRRDDREALFVADIWGNRTIDTANGGVRLFPPPAGVTAASSIAVTDEVYALAGIWPVGGVYVMDRASNTRLKSAGLGAPYGMQFLPDNQLLVADFKSNAIVRLAAGKDTGRQVVADGLRGPVGLALGSAANVYVSEWTAGAITRIDISSGARTEIARGLAHPEGLAMLPDGRLAVADTGTGRLLAIDPANGRTEELAAHVPMGLAGGPDVPLPFLPTGVAVGARGDIFVSSDLDNAIYRVSRRAR